MNKKNILKGESRRKTDDRNDDSKSKAIELKDAFESLKVDRKYESRRLGDDRKAEYSIEKDEGDNRKNDHNSEVNDIKGEAKSLDRKKARSEMNDRKEDSKSDEDDRKDSLDVWKNTSKNLHDSLGKLCKKDSKWRKTEGGRVNLFFSKMHFFPEIMNQQINNLQSKIITSFIIFF